MKFWLIDSPPRSV